MNAGVIVYVSIDEFYTAIELIERPELAGLPLIICSEDIGTRCTVLAVNKTAASHGVRTGQRVSQAKKICPNAAFLTPRFDLYKERAKQIREILENYGSNIEPFGLDVYWLKLDGKKAKETADAIARDIRAGTGLIASVGVSYSRAFARLASRLCIDCDVTVVTSENFRELIWPMPVDALLFVGLHTTEKLAHANINTVGQLAMTDVDVLERLLGQPGRTLWHEANGIGRKDVGGGRTVDRISNSWTLPRHATSYGEIVGAFSWLAENIARRATSEGCTGNTLQISITDMTHVRQTRDMPLATSCRDAKTLLEAAMFLFREYFNLNIPVYSLGLTLKGIEPESLPGQLTFGDMTEAHPS